MSEFDELLSNYNELMERHDKLMNDHLAAQDKIIDLLERIDRMRTPYLQKLFWPGLVDSPENKA